MRRFAPLFLLLSSTLALSGCLFDTGGGSYYDDPDPEPRGEGKIFISWTIGGQLPSPTSCTGIDHIRLQLETYNGAVVGISPIPCTLDRFRFDHMPEGAGVIRLIAVDAKKCEVARGRSSITITQTQPMTPSPVVAISAPKPCL
jgi:hypothetical protein